MTRATDQDPSAAHPRVLPLLLVLATLLVFLNSLWGAFVLDDKTPVDDAAARVGDRTVAELFSPPPIVALDRRVVVQLTFALNYALSGAEPRAYHALNILIHALAVLALYGVARRTLARPELPSEVRAAAPWLAFATALLWAVHPLQTQSVTYIVQRSEALMGLFYLLTLYAAIRGAEAEAGSAPTWYAAAVIACALGMASKEVMVTAPLLVLLYDRTFLAGGFAAALRRRWPLYAGLAATWVLFWVLGARELFLGRPANAGPPMTAGFSYGGVGPVAYLLSEAGVILHYLRLSVWPDRLVLDYLWPVARTPREVVPQTLAVGGLFLLTLWALWRRPAAGFLGAWFFLILATTSSVVPIADLAMEHRMYLPLAAVCAAAVLGLYALARRTAAHRSLLSDAGRLTVAAAVVLAAALGARTVVRNRDYRTARALYAANLAARPQNSRVHRNLASELMREAAETGDTSLLAQAATHIEARLRDKPDDAEAHRSLGALCLDLRRFDEAEAHLRRVEDLEPGDAVTAFLLARCSVLRGRPDDAIPWLEEAVARSPGYVPARLDLGRLLLERGRPGEAVAYLRVAASRSLENVEAQTLLADALAAAGQPDAAVNAYERALGMTDDVNPDLMRRMTWVLATSPTRRRRPPDQVVDLAGTALRLSRGGPRFTDTLAAALAAAGRFEEAVPVAERAAADARAAGDAELASEIDARVALYRAGRPYLTPTPATQPVARPAP